MTTHYTRMGLKHQGPMSVLTALFRALFPPMSPATVTLLALDLVTQQQMTAQPGLIECEADRCGYTRRREACGRLFSVFTPLLYTSEHFIH